MDKETKNKKNESLKKTCIYKKDIRLFRKRCKNSIKLALIRIYYAAIKPKKLGSTPHKAEKRSQIIVSYKGQNHKSEKFLLKKLNFT